MSTANLFRATAIAWIVTALARVSIAVAGMAPTNVSPSTTLVTAAGGVAVGLAGAWLLWTRRNRRSAVITSAFGFYAVLGIVALPRVGPDPWFVILFATGVLAVVLSLACLAATWRQPST